MKTHYYYDHIVDICNMKHLTVDQIFEALSEKFPEAGRSSVYRNVEELVKIGSLKKITGVGKKAYFEKNVGTHIHLVDKNTGEIVDLNEKIVIPNLPGNFKVIDYDIRVIGEFSA